VTRLPSLVAALWACIWTIVASGADWPRYRHDASRSAASAESLPASLHLAWVRELPAPRPAFPTEVRLGYDATYEPVVLAQSMFVPSMITDSVTALDTKTGAERWRFFAEGPVRLAPVAWEDKVYFVSDDGHLYCVGAGDGRLRWKLRGLPPGREDRKVMGNGRLVQRRTACHLRLADRREVGQGAHLVYARLHPAESELEPLDHAVPRQRGLHRSRQPPDHFHLERPRRVQQQPVSGQRRPQRPQPEWRLYVQLHAHLTGTRARIRLSVARPHRRRSNTRQSEG
jgi:hypothetical protein